MTLQLTRPKPPPATTPDTEDNGPYQTDTFLPPHTPGGKPANP